NPLPSNRHPPLYPKAAQPDPRKPNLTDRIIPTFPCTQIQILDSLSNIDIRSIYVFAKTPQIKKPDGKPLLRRDIQFALLSNIFVVFPEMRAQLRTYHPIPALQSGQEQNAKLLQDAPRIKSILKGVQEDRNEPFTWEQLLECRKRGLKPLTSPVSLIFLFGTYCQKMTELHFSPPREFYDLFNRTSVSSSSRANAFLWLCWHYLETDGSPDAAARNP